MKAYVLAETSTKKDEKESVANRLIHNSRGMELWISAYSLIHFRLWALNISSCKLDYFGLKLHTRRFIRRSRRIWSPARMAIKFTADGYKHTGRLFAPTVAILFPIFREGFLTAIFEKSYEKIAQADWLTSDSQRRGYKTSGTASVSSESLFIRQSRRLMNASGALGDFLRSLRLADKIAQCVTPLKSIA